MNDDVRNVKDRVDIVDVIAERVRLTAAGRDYVGLCPFHDEKTPSFHVSRERQSFHCFGCGKGGDVFTFVMESEGLDFRAALELLADRAGVELTANREAYEKNSRRRGLHDVMELAARVFRSLLSAAEGSAARAYLARRNVSDSDAARFELGWSAASWDSLWRRLRDEGVSPREAMDAGLVVEGQNGIYDRFRGRVMFPIRDLSGRVVAFGGRIVDGEGAKYINSPEGVIYSKRKNLYMLRAARDSIRERKRAILVEGYMDVLRLHMSGYTEAVASLGTSLTEEQAGLLKRFSDRCLICYDSDTAGQDATLRGMYTLQSLGLDVSVVALPKELGKDPDELLCFEGGKEIFDAAVASARPLVLQHLHVVRPLLDSPERGRGLASLFEGLTRLSIPSLAPYAPQLAAAMGIYPHQFWDEIKKAAQRRSADRRPENRAEGAPTEADGEGNEALDPMEAAMCSLLWRDEEFRSSCDAAETVALLSGSGVKDVAAAILTDSPEELEERWHMTGEVFPMRVIALGDAFRASFQRGEDTPILIAGELRRKRNEERVKMLEARMKQGSATPDDMAEFNRLAALLKAKS
ncbi:MAG: DNA primase [Synergistaceae bacterium]|jgi:DNA primase|nr:DNA primase [Synergistaceae bacterium]